MAFTIATLTGEMTIKETTNPVNEKAQLPLKVDRLQLIQIKNCIGRL